MRDNHVTTKVLFLNKVIPAGQTLYSSEIIELAALQLNGNYSLEIEHGGGAGTLNIFYEATAQQASTDANRFLSLSVAGNIFEDFGSAGGAGGDGRDIKGFNIVLCNQVRFGATAATADVTINRLILTLQ